MPGLTDEGPECFLGPYWILLPLGGSGGASGGGECSTESPKVQPRRPVHTLVWFYLFQLRANRALGPRSEEAAAGQVVQPLSALREARPAAFGPELPVSSGSQVPGCSEARLGSGRGPGRPRRAQALCLALAGCTSPEFPVVDPGLHRVMATQVAAGRARRPGLELNSSVC